MSFPFCLSAGVDLELKYEGVTALWLATQRGHAKVVESLLAEGAKTDIVSPEGVGVCDIRAVDGADPTQCQRLIREHNDAQVNGLEAFLDKESNDSPRVDSNTALGSGDALDKDNFQSLLGDVLRDDEMTMEDEVPSTGRSEENEPIDDVLEQIANFKTHQAAIENHEGVNVLKENEVDQEENYEEEFEDDYGNDEFES